MEINRSSKIPDPIKYSKIDNWTESQASGIHGKFNKENRITLFNEL
jgi:hypothetical protein